MKTRLDFVTNSSSSSFVINKSALTPEQRELLLNKNKLFELISKTYNPPCNGRYDKILTFEEECHNCESFVCEAAGWKIRETDDKIVGCTIMDNFDMIGFLQKIGIPVADHGSDSGIAGLYWLYEKYGIDPFEFFQKK